MESATEKRKAAEQRRWERLGWVGGIKWSGQAAQRPQGLGFRMKSGRRTWLGPKLRAAFLLLLGLADRQSALQH